MSSTAFPPLSPPEPPRVFGAPALYTENDLLALGVAADGTVWSVEEPGLLRQWDLATRRQKNQWMLDEAATVWAFNWAGRLLASGSSEVDVWEISSGESLVGWTADSWVTALAFQPFKPVLATGHDDGVVRVWEWADRRLLHEFRAHESAVSAVSFSWDQARLATAGEDRLVRLWDLNTGRPLGSLEGHTDRVPALAWHPDNRRLFSAGWDTTVRVWDTQALQPIILLNSHASQVHAIALSGDGKMLASADSAQSVHVWDADAYREQAVLRERTGEVRFVCFTPDDGKGNRTPPVLAFGSADRVIHLWNTAQNPETVDLDPLLHRVGVAVSPDGKRLFSLGGGTNLRAWEIGSGLCVAGLDNTPVMRSMALSPDGKTLAATKLESSVEDRSSLGLYDAGSGTLQGTCEGQRGPITALAFRGDGKLLASGGVQSCDVWLWDVPSGQPHLILPDAVDRCSVEALAFQPKGDLLAVAGIDYLATGGSDGHVTLWHPGEKRQVGSLEGGASAIAWSPDGKRLAAATLRKTVRVFDAADGTVVAEVAGHQDLIGGIAYSPDGKYLATASDDRTVRLWDSASGEQAGAWELDNAVKAVAFSPDGKWLFTGNGNTSCYQIEVEQLRASGM